MGLWFQLFLSPYGEQEDQQRSRLTATLYGNFLLTAPLVHVSFRCRSIQSRLVVISLILESPTQSWEQSERLSML